MKFKVGDRVFSPKWPDLWNNSTIIEVRPTARMFPYRAKTKFGDVGTFQENELEFFSESNEFKVLEELEELRKFKEEAIKKHPNLAKCKMEIFVENLMGEWEWERIDLESAILEAIQYGQENPVK